MIAILFDSEMIAYWKMFLIFLWSSYWNKFQKMKFMKILI